MAESSVIEKSGRSAAWSEDDLKTALQALKNGVCGLNECARVYGISKPTLRRHFLNKNKFAKDGVKVRGRSTNLPAVVEEDLVQHILKLENMMFGVTRKDLMSLAYQIAEANGLQHNFNIEKKMAGKDWFVSFIKRHPSLSLRHAEPTSIARAFGFNKVAVDGFYDKLKYILDEHSLQADEIYSVDETNLSTVPKTGHRVVAAKGKRQVGSLSSAEKGVTSTGVFCMNAAGYFLHPMVIFKRKRMKDELRDGAPPGTIFGCNESGWMDSELFNRWIDHFIACAKPSKQNPKLLILDGHATHTKNLDAITKASESGMIMLSLPPHTTHRLQPLDVSIFKPLQTYYEQEAEKWLHLHPGRGLTTFHVCRLMGHAFPKVASMANAISGFRATGIWPFDRDVFGEHEFSTLRLSDHLEAARSSIATTCTSERTTTIHCVTSPSTQPMTSAPAHLVTSVPSQLVTSSLTQPVALAPTQLLTSIPAEAVTSAPTQLLTSVPTQPVTSSSSTQLLTSAPTQPVASVPTQLLTSVPIQPVTSSSTQLLISTSTQLVTSAPDQPVTCTHTLSH